jgi:glycosyltransferase involved in cell wall biosynthesis
MARDHANGDGASDTRERGALRVKTHVVFMIRRLDRGGAERQLIQLAQSLNKEKFEVSIVTFYRGGGFAAEIAADSGIRVLSLDRSGSWDIVKFVVRLLFAMRRMRPQIIHGYMGGANELSLIAGRACGARVVWGMRASDPMGVPTSLGMHSLFLVGALLSPLSDRIIVNSQIGRTFYASNGYCAKRLTVIPNGIDTTSFGILPDQRARIRQEWGVADCELLIGRAARLDPRKDYPSFLKAAGRVSRLIPAARFVCVGDDTDCVALRAIAAAEGIADRVIWAGGRADMPAVYNALDICVSSSLTEGFPNAVAESMACGTPCVATNVGDSALLLGDAGLIVAAGDSDALADGVLRMIAERQQYSRDRVRQRIIDNFGLERLAYRTEAEFEKLLRS